MPPSRRPKRGLAISDTKRGKSTSIMAVADRCDTHLAPACGTKPPSPHERRLVESTLAAKFLDEVPERLIGDRAYNSDGLDRQLAEDYAIEMIAPHYRYLRKTYGKCALRRYLRRWMIERLFAGHGIYRHPVIRWEVHDCNFLGMVQLACSLVLARHL